jgi:transposase
MPNPLRLELSNEQKRELEQARDKHPKAYIRERCAAILKIAAGQSAHQVALFGLYKKRAPDTVYMWLHRYQVEGLDGLFMREGRGRKAAFSPSLPD